VPILKDTEQQKKEFREDGQKSMAYRKMIESELNNRFSIVCLPPPPNMFELALLTMDPPLEAAERYP
jgi:hypothetical protein